MKINRYTFQKIALALSIIIVLNLLFNYGIFTFYPSLEYDDFCGEETNQFYDSKDKCEAIGGEWAAYNQGQRPVKVTPVEGEVAPTEYCDASASSRGYGISNKLLIVSFRSRALVDPA